MLINNKKIAIAGGGPGGLTLARLLQMKGADVTVYERDVNKDTRVQGATLDLHEESGLAALQAADLMDAFMASYRPGAELLRIVDANANIVYDQHEENHEATIAGPNFRPEIDRGPLRKLLLESLQPETVVWDSHIVSAQPDNAGWQLTFKNGKTAYADILIGADGANSKIRPLVTPIKPFYSGVTVVEGNVYDAANKAPWIYSLLKEGKIFALAHERTLIISSKEDGSIAFYTGCKTDEDWVRNCGIDFKDSSALLTWFKEEFEGWSHIWHELFDGEDTSFIPRPQYCMPLDQDWAARENITLLGDAAHLMPPYAGEGVNMAMQDALELSQYLTSNEFGNIQDAIATYEAGMRKRAAMAAKMTLDNTVLLHSPNAIPKLMEAFKAYEHDQ